MTSTTSITSTTWTTLDSALDHWTTPELVAYYMAGTETLRLSDDETEVEANA